MFLKLPIILFGLFFLTHLTSCKNTPRNSTEAGSESSLSVNKQGVLYTPEEVGLWTERYKAYLEKTLSGQSSKPVIGSHFNSPNESPGQFSRIISSKDAFLKLSRGSEVVKANANCSGNAMLETTCLPHEIATNQYGKSLSDASFYYLISGDENVVSAIKTYILDQVREPSWNYSRLKAATVNEAFGFPMWLMRIAESFDNSKLSPIYSNSEKNEILTWLRQAGEFNKKKYEVTLIDSISPTRNSRDYSKASYFLTSFYLDKGYEIFHVDAKGNPGPLSGGPGQYNNRVFTFMAVSAFIGGLLKDRPMIEAAAVTVEELLKFGIKPDGTPDEWLRNFSWNNPSQGLLYFAVTMDSAILVADIMARLGDPYLYNLVVTEGAWTSGGGVKSIKKTIENHYNIITKKTDLYAVAAASAQTQNTTKCLPPTLNVSLASPTYSNPFKVEVINQTNAHLTPFCKITHINPFDGGYGWHDLSFLPAQVYYKDPVFEEIIMRTAPGSDQPVKNQRIQSAGPAGEIWGGLLRKTSDLYIKFAERKSLDINPYPVKLTAATASITPYGQVYQQKLGQLKSIPVSWEILEGSELRFVSLKFVEVSYKYSLPTGTNNYLTMSLKENVLKSSNESYGKFTYQPPNLLGSFVVRPVLTLMDQSQKLYYRQLSDFTVEVKP